MLFPPAFEAASRAKGNNGGYDLGNEDEGLSTLPGKERERNNNGIVQGACPTNSLPP